MSARERVKLSRAPFKNAHAYESRINPPRSEHLETLQQRTWSAAEMADQPRIAGVLIALLSLLTVAKTGVGMFTSTLLRSITISYVCCIIMISQVWTVDKFL